MNYTYRISTLTCQSCVERATRALTAVPGVSHVGVSFASSLVSLDVEREISLDELNSFLSRSTSFVLTEIQGGLRERLRNTVRAIERYRPLAIIYLMIALFMLVRQMYLGFDIHLAMHDFMAGFFILFGSIKVVNLKRFAAAYVSYDDMARRIPGWSYTYPFIEIALGIAFFFGYATGAALIASAVLMSIKAYSVQKAVWRGAIVQCACLGGFFSIPISWVTFWEDAVMVAMAVMMLAYGA